MSENIIVLKQNAIRMSVISTTLLLIIKLFAGTYTGTISIISESIHSGVDLLATLIAFYSIRKSATAPDDDHPYGHGKFENLSGAMEAMLIILAAILIFYEAYQKFSNVNSPEFLEYGIIVMLLSMTVNYLVSHKLITVAKQTSSPALEADACHLHIDVWTSGGILAGLFLIQITGWIWIDPIIAIIISIIICKTGYTMVKKNISELTDISFPEKEQQLISEIVNHHEYVLSLKRLRTRFSGNYRLIDIHLGLDKNMHLEKAHAICDELETEINNQLGICDIVIHLEPHEREKVSLLTTQ